MFCRLLCRGLFKHLKKICDGFCCYYKPYCFFKFHFLIIFASVLKYNFIFQLHFVINNHAKLILNFNILSIHLENILCYTIMLPSNNNNGIYSFLTFIFFYFTCFVLLTKTVLNLSASLADNKERKSGDLYLIPNHRGNIPYFTINNIYYSLLQLSFTSLRISSIINLLRIIMNLY